MPTAPASPCAVPGCPYMAKARGRCERHLGDQVYEGLRARPWQRFYDTAVWRKLSHRVLEEEKVCRGYPPGKVCGRRTRHADHIVPIQEGGARLDRANVQGLCASCHGSKTQDEAETRARRRLKSHREPRGVG